jgi:S-adenosylmethionine synthetase
MKEGNIDAGHLWSAGGHSNIRFNEYNVNAQCSRPCNKDKSGDTNNYRIQFIKRYSQEILDQLDLEAHVVKKWNIEELMDLIAIYKQKFQELSKK